MPPPAGVSLCCFLVAAAALTPRFAFAQESRDQLRHAIRRDVPRYDPGAHEKAQAGQAARDEAVKKALAELPPENPAAPPAGPPARSSTDGAGGDASIAGEKRLELPTVIVRPNHEAPKRLPRLDAPKPLRDIKAEPFESAAGKHDRVMKKHLSGFGRALARIPFLGMGVAGSAHEAEAREQKAAQMNDLASGIEIQEALGRDPEEIKKLRAEYKKLYYSGPAK